MPPIGFRHSEESKALMSLNRMGKGSRPGAKHPMWKGGVSKDRKYKTQRLKEWRHKKGISVHYGWGWAKLDPIAHKERIRFHNRKHKYLRKKAGCLQLEIVQRVYEDNVKHYGTLTCYLCRQPILFGDDNLEHKTPISRGGTNVYANLGIAHRSCNFKKSTLTEEEYRRKNETYIS